MKKLLTLSLLSVFGVTILGCEAHMDVDPHTTHTTTTGGEVDKKTTTVRDANGNVVEKKTTETRNP